MKRPELLAATANQLAGCSCHRQIARSTKAAKTSITRMAERKSLVLRADGRGDYKVALWDAVLKNRVVLETYPNPERGPALWIYRTLWTRSLPQLDKKHTG